MAKPPDRQARLSKALRENLKRRKAHASRSRKIHPGHNDGGAGTPEGEDPEAQRPNSADKNS